MENYLKVTGTNDKELLLALKLAYELKFGSSMYRGIYTWGEDSEYIYFSNNHETNEVCTDKFPCAINEEVLLSIITEYLKSFNKKDLGGDGSTGRGWTLEISNWASKYDFKVKFETMYYGK